MTVGDRQARPPGPRRSSAAIVAALLTGLVGGACDRDEPRPRPSSSAPTTRAATAGTASATRRSDSRPPVADRSGRARVRLQRPGQAPRRRLRHRFAPGEHRELALDLQLRTEVGDEPPVALHLRTSLRMRVVETEDDGATIEMVVGEAEAPAEPIVTAALEALRDRRARFTVDRRGRLGREPRLEPEVAEEAASQIWTSLAEACAEAWAPLPVEPIGRGAQWTARRRIRRGGVPLWRTVAYRLVEDRPRVRIRGEVEETPLGGEMSDAALPAGVTVEAASGAGLGRRRLAFEPGAGFALAADSEVAVDLRLKVRAETGVGIAERTRPVKITQIITLVSARALDSAEPAGQKSR